MSMQLPLLAQIDRVARESPVAVDRRRLNAAARRVLAYLQAHESATNVELAQPHVGGLRFGGRIFELREHGWVIDDERPAKGGLWRYRLSGRKAWG